MLPAFYILPYESCLARLIFISDEKVFHAFQLKLNQFIHAIRKRDMKNAYNFFGKVQEKRQIGRPRHREENIFKMYVKGTVVRSGLGYVSRDIVEWDL
jgi:hypothetical protein